MMLISDDELTMIEWRVTRGTHFEGATLLGSEYALQVINKDVPKMLAEIRLQNKHLEQLRASLMVVLDCIDYTSGACQPTEMIAAILPKNVLENARKAAALLAR